MKYPKPTLVAAVAAFFVAFALPAFAQFDRGGGDRGRNPPRAAPGPVAGVGLPFMVAAGAYWLVRRRTRTARRPGSVAQS